MRHILIFVLLLSNSCSFVSFSQRSITLQSYCPTQAFQYGATCFAYATTYTALSIMHNVKNKITDERNSNFKAFSDGFVMSKVKRDKFIIDRVDNKCGKDAGLESAFKVLKSSGTVLKTEFPYNCKSNKVNRYEERAAEYKIKNYRKIGDETSNPQRYLQDLKNVLRQNTPIVVAIFQEDFFQNNKNDVIQFPPNHKKSAAPADHDVCIVGYDDDKNGGSFLVKNNYSNWGKNGFAYVSYDDMMRIIRRSYVIEL